MLSQAVNITLIFRGRVAVYSRIWLPAAETPKIGGEVFKWRGKVEAALISNSLTSTATMKCTPSRRPLNVNTQGTDGIGQTVILSGKYSLE